MQTCTRTRSILLPRRLAPAPGERRTLWHRWLPLLRAAAGPPDLVLPRDLPDAARPRAAVQGGGKPRRARCRARR